MSPLPGAFATASAHDEITPSNCGSTAVSDLRLLAGREAGLGVVS